jgi:hypothetical protein
MDCVTAAPFVSLLFDGHHVPDDAARHIAGCTTCQTELRAWSEAAARLRIVAAVDRIAPIPPLALEAHEPVATPKRAFWRGWMTPMRVPRMAAAMATFLVIVSGVGWFRAYTAPRAIDELHYEMSFGCKDPSGGSVTSTGAGTQLVGSRTQFYTSSACHGTERGLSGVIDPVRVRDGVLTLRLGVEVVDAMAPGPGAATRTIDPAIIREYQFVTGQSIDVPVPGGPPMRFTGRVVRRANAPSPPSTIDALLPKPGELAITMPALLRDGREVVVTINAGTTSKAGDVTTLYAPGAGLFLFGLDPFEGATPALAGGAALTFEAGGNKYALYSTLPMTAGEQPRRVWVRHLREYRPAGQGGELPSLGTGSPSTYR